MTGAPPLFDRALSAARAARKRGSEPNILTRTIAEELVERLAFVNRRFEQVRFAGEQHVGCRLLAGPTRDFNVIVRRGPFTAHARRRNSASDISRASGSSMARRASVPARSG